MNKIKMYNGAQDEDEINTGFSKTAEVTSA